MQERVQEIKGGKDNDRMAASQLVGTSIWCWSILASGLWRKCPWDKKKVSF
jgi:hypothetical protein